jgi:hypothetical protein
MFDADVVVDRGNDWRIIDVFEKWIHIGFRRISPSITAVPEQLNIYFGTSRKKP